MDEEEILEEWLDYAEVHASSRGYSLDRGTLNDLRQQFQQSAHDLVNGRVGGASISTSAPAMRARLGVARANIGAVVDQAIGILQQQGQSGGVIPRHILTQAIRRGFWPFT
jgi:hypothetical protein